MACVMHQIVKWLFIHGCTMFTRLRFLRFPFSLTQVHTHTPACHGILSSLIGMTFNRVFRYGIYLISRAQCCAVQSNIQKWFWFMRTIFDYYYCLSVCMAVCVPFFSCLWWQKISNCSKIHLIFFAWLCARFVSLSAKFIGHRWGQFVWYIYMCIA